MTFPLPQGYRYAGVHCGLKSKPHKEDLTLIVSDTPATAAGVYTQNVVHAAPVTIDRERTPQSDCRVVVVNSGNANACTGAQGMTDALAMLASAASAVGAEESQSLVMSTGIIGVFLPMDKVNAGIAAASEKLAAGEEAFQAAARGILTTDKGMKVASRTVKLSDGEITLAGMAKGAGMIGPNMATMLGVILTDANLAPDDAQAMLTAAANESFNCISVEGHTSTNDTLLLLANGAAGGNALSASDREIFQRELTELAIELAKMIPDDGEGSTHLVAIEVTGCIRREDAHQIAKTIADSALVKTAVTGGDPNWGRIVSAAGYAGVAFDPAKVGLQVNGHQLYENGAPIAFDAATVSKAMKENRETSIQLTLGEGDVSGRFWTSDLTVEYVKFNSEYTT